MFAFAHSLLGKTKRMTPCARSYSVSVNDRTLRPSRPIAPESSSLPPTMNWALGMLPLSRLRSAPAMRALVLPLMPNIAKSGT